MTTTTTAPTSGEADLPEALRIANVLDLAKQIDYYNHVQDDLEAAAAELRRLHTLTVQQQRDLIAESHRTAEQKLRADQMTVQHGHQAALNTEARAQLAELRAQLESIGAGGVSALTGAAKAGSEPVAWQYRSVRDKGLWFDCTEERAQQRAAHPDKWDVRYLYTHPSPQEGMAGWQPIETAPKDGTELLLWREDCGQFIGSYTSADGFPLTQDEIDAMDEETLFTKDWFTQWPDARRLDGSEAPIKWQPLPVEPSMDGESNG